MWRQVAVDGFVECRNELDVVSVGVPMTGSGGSSLSVRSASHCSHMISSRTSTCRGRVDGGYCSKQVRSGRVWYSNLILVVTLLSLSLSAHSQDELAQNRAALNKEIYLAAFNSLNSTKVRTGDIYNATLTDSLRNQSVELVQMVRLRSGSLYRYGVQLNEITLRPKGVKVVRTFSNSVILVYRRFSQYPYYNATPGDVFVAPVVGILVYDAINLINYTNIVGPELQVVAEGPSIEVQLQLSRNITGGNLTCIMFNNTVNGSAAGVVQNVSASSTVGCSWNMLGDYSILAPYEEIRSPSKKSSHKAWKIAVGSVAGGLVLLVLLSLLGLLGVRYRERAKFANMEHKSEQGETLGQTLVGGSRAPAAPSTRTKPVLESDNPS